MAKKEKKAREAEAKKEKKARDAEAKKEKKARDAEAKKEKKAREAYLKEEKKPGMRRRKRKRKIPWIKRKTNPLSRSPGRRTYRERSHPWPSRGSRKNFARRTKNVRFGGVTGRSGWHRAKRVQYGPSTGRERRSPSKPSIKKKQDAGLNPVRSTFDDRVTTAKKRARGREQAKDKENQCNVIEFVKNVADRSKNREEKYASTKRLVVAHGMGSGKTLTSLWVAKEYITKNRVDFVNILAPNVAAGEFIDSFERAGITPHMAGRIRVLTHDEFVLNRKGCARVQEVSRDRRRGPYVHRHQVRCFSEMRCTLYHASQRESDTQYAV